LADWPSGVSCYYEATPGMPWPLRIVLMPGVGAGDLMPRVRIGVGLDAFHGAVLNPAQLRHLAALLIDAAEKATDVAVELLNERQEK